MHFLNKKIRHPAILILLVCHVPDDQQLMVFVNVLGLSIFLAVISYHYIVATKDNTESS